MNNGKICVPVAVSRVEDIVNKARKAAEFADVIELRLDALENADPAEIRKQIRKIRGIFAGDILVTFRPKTQGGARELDTKERRSLLTALETDADLIDIEYDLDLTLENTKTVHSFHDFEGVPDDLVDIYDRLAAKARENDIIKIAVRPADIVDGLGVWKLLSRGGRQVIPIAMGEAGKWTRILGPAFGAPLTFGSLEAGDETAPGQITAKDLSEIYRVKELTPQTAIYGVIGRPVSKSLSPYMHNAAFQAAGIDAVFMHLEVSDLPRFIEEFVPRSGLKFGGFSVTMPHKQAIIPYLSGMEESARAIGAVNTLKIEDGKLFGFNTDAEGFIAPLKQTYGDLKGVRVALLGAGGAARACVYALKKERADVTVFVRDPEKGRAFAEEFDVEPGRFPVETLTGFEIAVNATPIGMGAGEEDLAPLYSEQFGDVSLVYDLITKPAETALLREAKKRGLKTIGGAEMLIAQGIRQFEIWTGKDAPAALMREKVLERLFN